MSKIPLRILWSVLFGLLGYGAGLYVVIEAGVALYGDYRKGIGPYSFLVPAAGALLGALTPWALAWYFRSK